MSKPVVTIDEERDIEEAAALMLGEGIARLPVVRAAVSSGSLRVRTSCRVSEAGRSGNEQGESE